MKICWNNLEELRLTKRGNLIKMYPNGSWRTYYFKICTFCYEDYIGIKSSVLCSPECQAKKGHSEETKKKMSEIHKGKVVSEESRRKMSISKKEMYANGYVSPLLGRTTTEEHRKNMKKNHYYCSGVNNSFYDKKHTEETLRKISQNRTYLYGEEHPSWRGGHSYRDYCPVFFNREYKQSIRDRDGNLCLNCSRTEDQEGRKLSVHHINYDKKNCDLNNLVTVCNKCNTQANKDREWHTEWYKLMLTKRYGYKY